MWAWTDLLAHGSDKDLGSELTMGLPRRDKAVRQWHEARSYLAAEVLWQAAQYGSLEEVQEAVLMPLDLDLASRTDVIRWRPGRSLVVVVYPSKGLVSLLGTANSRPEGGARFSEPPARG